MFKVVKVSAPPSHLPFSDKKSFVDWTKSILIEQISASNNGDSVIVQNQHFSLVDSFESEHFPFIGQKCHLILFQPNNINKSETSLFPWRLPFPISKNLLFLPLIFTLRNEHGSFQSLSISELQKILLEWQETKKNTVEEEEDDQSVENEDYQEEEEDDDDEDAQDETNVETKVDENSSEDEPDHQTDEEEEENEDEFQEEMDYE